MRAAHWPSAHMARTCGCPRASSAGWVPSSLTGDFLPRALERLREAAVADGWPKISGAYVEATPTPPF